MSDVTSGEKTCWFVMRDLGRTSLDKSYYKLFKDNGFEAYTPLKWQLVVKNGKRSRVQVPVIRDLLFVHDVRSRIEAFIQKYSAIQFRYVRGAYCCPFHKGYGFYRFAGVLYSLRHNSQHVRPQDTYNRWPAGRLRR